MKNPRKIMSARERVILDAIAKSLKHLDDNLPLETYEEAFRVHSILCELYDNLALKYRKLAEQEATGKNKRPRAARND